MAVTPYYEADGITIYHGDCLDVMRELAAGSVDAIVTDPPYGLGFMGKAWDTKSAREFEAWCEGWGREALRVAKPGAHLLAFGAPRTSHRLVAGLEDAGWEIRDTVAWMFGSGFPKSLDVSKALDRRPGAAAHDSFAVHLAERREAKGLSRADVSEAVVGTRSGACWNWEHHQFPKVEWWPALRDLLNLDERWGQVLAEAEREEIGVRKSTALAVAPGQGVERIAVDLGLTAPATDLAVKWQGWGTALKPAYEPVVLARKPLGGTVAATVAEHGTGALNIDACRVGSADSGWARPTPVSPAPKFGTTAYAKDRWTIEQMARGANTEGNPAGRWPANVVLDESAAAMLDAAVGEAESNPHIRRNTGAPSFAKGKERPHDSGGYGDTGGPSRFFYTAKASRSEREAGLAHLEPVRRTDGRKTDIENPRLRTSERRNHHPTVKPVSLMRWLVRLVTPPGGIVLDPFMGSGSTRIAAQAEGARFIGIEQDGEYLEIAVSRLAQLGMPMEVAE